jgi:hypothetical protein
MSVITDTVTSLVAKLSVSAITSLITIIEAAIASGNPARYLKRLAAAQAAQAATKATVGEALKQTAKKAK